jgi:probable rRNA maturation factor
VIVEARSVPARGAAAARRLRERARRYLSALGREDAEVSLLVVDDAGIRRLNQKWRGKDEATDVLSFPQSGGAGPLLGDLVISLQTARRVARRDGRPVEAELDRYLAHGLLHLLGYDHARPADARNMAAAENALVGEGMIAASRRRSGSGSSSRSRSGPRSRSGSGSRSGSRSEERRK